MCACGVCVCMCVDNWYRTLGLFRIIRSAVVRDWLCAMKILNREETCVRTAELKRETVRLLDAIWNKLFRAVVADPANLYENYKIHYNLYSYAEMFLLNYTFELVLY